MVSTILKIFGVVKNKLVLSAARSALPRNDDMNLAIFAVAHEVDEGQLCLNKVAVATAFFTIQEYR